MFDAMHDVDSKLLNLKPPKRCHVTTMTFVATVSHSLTITQEVIDELACIDDPYFTTIGDCAFSSSCVELHSLLLPSVRTKLLNHGALQITGCKSHVEAMHTIAEVCRVLSYYTGEAVEALSMDIALINLNTTIERGIHLTRVAEAARVKGIMAEQPERPPSCILKVPSSSNQPNALVTALIYKPGKFVICGARTPHDVSLMYTHIMQILDMHGMLEPRNKDALRRSRGNYTWTQLVRQGMPGVMHDHNPTKSHVATCLYCQRLSNAFIPQQT